MFLTEVVSLYCQWHFSCLYESLIYSVGLVGICVSISFPILSLMYLCHSFSYEYSFVTMVWFPFFLGGNFYH